MTHIICPVCHNSSCHNQDDCTFCPTFHRAMGEANIPDLIPPDIYRDPRHAFEIGRYEAIEEAGLEDYAHYAPTRPRYRARLMADLLRENKVAEYVDVGPGFGFLEEETPDMERWALDHSLGFLNATRKRAPGTHCVRAVAERLPVANVPCLVSDSTFQTLVDREAFLCEAARACELLVLTVGFRANYPRKPQGGFNVLRDDERATLSCYLGELGFETEWWLWNVEKGWRAQTMDEADYLYIIGRKR